MVSYICFRCGYRVNIESVSYDSVVCPKCACRILIKETPNVVKRVSCD